MKKKSDFLRRSELPRLVKLLRSRRFSAILAGVFVVFAAVSSFIPQGREPEYYTERFSDPAGIVILLFQLDLFFTSPLFLLLTGLFFLNLLLCTVYRFLRARRLRTSWGPDIIHVGLLLLVAGGVITALWRIERTVYLEEGRSLSLPGNAMMHIRAVRETLYEDGRPKEWVTVVDLGNDPETTVEITVNTPLRTRGVSVYQSGFFYTAELTLMRGNLKSFLNPGGVITLPHGFLRYSRLRRTEPDGVETSAAVFEEWKDGVYIGERAVVQGDTIGAYTLSSMRIFPVTGLMVIMDPGYWPVLVSLVLIGIGLTVTFTGKLAATVKGAFIRDKQ